MPLPRSSTSSARSADPEPDPALPPDRGGRRPSPARAAGRLARGALALGLVLAAGAGLRDERADACGYEAPTIEELTTFDPGVLGEPAAEGLFYDPFNAGFGGPCADCATQAMLAEWRGFLKDAAVADADLQRLLASAPAAEVAALAGALAGRGAPPPGYERTSLWRSPARARVAAAAAVISLARRVEPYASFEAYGAGGSSGPPQAPPQALLAEALAGVKAAAREPFLAQRYAFQAMRILFYQRNWAAAIAFFDGPGKGLAGPSADLPWRARYYLAGALVHVNKRARANLELARVHAGSPALAGVAAQDFQPVEEADWRETLRLARDARERAMLWRLVGLKQDGIAAAREIARLDPRSSLMALLLVRELARAESIMQGGSPSPAQAAARRKAYAAIEALAAAQAATAGADRPWLMELVAAHAAARRGDVAAARPRLQRATAARPGDGRVAAQARATLALALAVDWRMHPGAEQELARTLLELDPKFPRAQPVREEVRGALAAAYARAGKLALAELLHPGAAGKQPGQPGWADPAFIKELIAQTGRTATPFERFVLAGSYQRPALERELALRYLVDGDFAAAARTFQTTTAASGKLGTDPFVIHIVDCHDCDHERYASAPWTHASLAARLADLERIARGTGDAAAEAALAIGNALYNITWYGNARVVLEETHHATTDTRAAERWYKRAYELARGRELRAKAAYLASKAELARLITAAGGPDNPPRSLPIPRTWFPLLRQLSDTRYYREVLRECGNFSAWARP